MAYPLENITSNKLNCVEQSLFGESLSDPHHSRRKFTASSAG